MKDMNLEGSGSEKTYAWNERPLSRRSILGSAGLLGLSTVSTVGAGQSTEQTDSWPSDQFDNRNTGYNPEVSGPHDGVEHVWTWSNSGFHWGQTINGQTVYAGGDGIYAVDSTEGSVVWDFVPDVDRSQFSTPTYAEDTVYAIDQEIENRVLYAVSAENGDEEWRYSIRFDDQFEFLSLPTISNGSVYFFVTSTDGSSVVCVDSTNGTERWQTELPSAGGATSTVNAPAVDQGTIYLGSVAVDSQTGDIVWQAEEEDTIDTTAVGENVVVSGFGRGLIAFDKATGQHQWIFGETRGIHPKGRPAIANGTVYYGRGRVFGDIEDFEGDVIAVDIESGEQRWEFDTDGYIMGSTTVADDVVYVGDSEGYLYGIDATNGEELWQFNQRQIHPRSDEDGFPFDDDLGRNTTISVAEDSLYIGGPNLPLYKLESSDTASSDAAFAFLDDSFGEDTSWVSMLLSGAVIGGLGFGAYRLLNNGNSSPEADSTEQPMSSSSGESISESSLSDSTISINSYSELQIEDTIKQNEAFCIKSAQIKHDTVWVLMPSEIEAETISANMFAEFEQNLTTWSSMDSHQNLLSVYGHGSTPFPWCCVEPATGSAISKVVDRLSTDELLTAVEQICEAVHHVHRYGTTYENLTTESVLYTDNNGVKLRGVIDQFDDPDPWYNAPEEFVSESTEQSTIYRIGLIAYELVTGTLPYAEYPDGVAREAVQSDELIPPSEQVDGIPPALEAIIMKALSKSPDNRHETVLHLRDEFDSIQDS